MRRDPVEADPLLEQFVQSMRPEDQKALKRQLARAKLKTCDLAHDAVDARFLLESLGLLPPKTTREGHDV